MLLGACAGQSGGQAGTLQAGQQPASPGTGLDRFYGQKPAFKPCDPHMPPGVPTVKAECARLKVPLDYQNPKGKQAEIALLRVPARAKNPIGSLLLNPGGPGFPGTEHAAITAAVWAKSPITERFDLVGFDPRGVGASQPALDCYTDAERDRDAKLSSIPAGITSSPRDSPCPCFQMRVFIRLYVWVFAPPERLYKVDFLEKVDGGTLRVVPAGARLQRIGGGRPYRGGRGRARQTG
ncbi:hypothetical protein AB0L53_41415 [Nonomuraea sp. NPDC052129]|uniref:hypothetical protein n=1 Tax=Nonomuraea sp. NPDC052129 TaxID=3154651 RepID=UPI003428DD35